MYLACEINYRNTLHTHTNGIKPLGSVVLKSYKILVFILNLILQALFYKNSFTMNYNNPSSENETERPKKRRRRKKHFSPYKKGKYAISKLEEYENYLNHIELLSRGGDLEAS